MFISPKTFLTTLFFVAALALQAQEQPKVKKRGKVKVYYENTKQIQCEGTNANYLREGVWTYYAKDGKVAQTETYHLGKLEGARKVYLNAVLVANEFYKNGTLDGLQDYYEFNGIQKMQLNFQAGQLHGQSWMMVQPLLGEYGLIKKVISGYEHGQLVYEKNLFENGRPMNTKYYENGKATGTWIKYAYRSSSNDTFPQEKTEYKNGLRNGYTRKYSMGILREESMYVNDLRDGPYRSWDAKSKLIGEGFFKNGEPHGMVQSYNDGKLATKVYFTKGHADSTFEYYPNGQLAEKILDYTIHDAQGKKPEVSHREVMRWNKQGQLILANYFINNTKEGTWYEAYDEGQKRSQMNYTNGVLNGRWEYWYADGKKAIDCVLKDNKIVGVAKVWNEEGVALKVNRSAYDQVIYNFAPEELQFAGTSDEIEVQPMQEEIMEVTQEARDEEGYGVAEPPRDSDRPKTKKAVDPNAIYDYPEVHASFPDGPKAMAAFIAAHLEYPQVDSLRKLEGYVALSIVIQKDGTITDIQLIHDVNGSALLAAEAARIYSSMPAWIAAKQNGNPVVSRMQVAVIFKLENN